MPMLVNRDEMIRRLHREKAAFEALLSGMTGDQLATLPLVGYWTMKDVLAHSIAHEQLALDELHHALRGEPLAIRPSRIDRFNAEAVESRRDQSLAEVHAAWDASFAAVVAAVTKLTDDDVDPDGPVAAALEDTVNGVLANNTYGHYAEHMVDIEAARADARRFLPFSTAP